MLPAFTILFIAGCVTHFSVLNSNRQFSFALVTTFVSIVILCELCDHNSLRKEGSRSTQSATQSTTHLKNKCGSIYPEGHLKL